MRACTKKSTRKHEHTCSSHTLFNCFKHTSEESALLCVCVRVILLHWNSCSSPHSPAHIRTHPHTCTHTLWLSKPKHMWRVMRLYGSLTRKHFLAQLKRQQWRRSRGRKTPLNNNKQKRNTAARSDKYLSPRLNKSSLGVGGGGLVVRKIFEPFTPAASIQTHSVSLWVTLFMRQGDKLLTSPLFSKASTDSKTDKDAQGEESKIRFWGKKVAKERAREQEEDEDEEWYIFFKISTRVSGSSQQMEGFRWKYLCCTTRLRTWG